MIYYSLQIYAPNKETELKLEKILGVTANGKSSTWEIEITDEELEINFLDYFLPILSGKYDELEKIGITRNDISIWLLYEYDGQCNLEFTPSEMLRLGQEGLALCISCWEKDDYFSIEDIIEKDDKSDYLN